MLPEGAIQAGSSPPRRRRPVLELPFDALPHRRLRDLLLPGVPRTLAPERAARPVEALHDRVELRLLRLVGLALRVAARGRQLRGAGGWTRGGEAGGTGSPAAGDGDRRRGDARAARVLQVLRLLRGQRDERPRTPGHPRRPTVDPGGAAGRHLVLLVHGGVLHRGHPARRHEARELDRPLPVPLVLPAPGRRADRAAERADPAARHPPRPAARRHRWRGVAHLRRVVQEGGRLELPGVGDRRPGVRRSRASRRGRGVVRGLGIRDRDLRRLQRLHGHRDRRGEAPGLPVPAELRPALHGSIAAGLLAPVAHDAQPLAARLPLHPARRLEEGRAPHVREHLRHDAAGRPVARRGVDVRVLGRVPRCGTGDRRVPAVVAGATRAAASHGDQVPRLATAVPDVPARLPRLGVLPRGLALDRVLDARAPVHRVGRARRRW